LVAELQPERDLSRPPLFLTWFALQNAPSTSFELAGIKLSQMRTEIATAKVDLALVITEKDRIGGAMIYNADLFDPETVDEFLRRYVALLAEVVDDCMKRILEIPLDAGANVSLLVGSHSHTPAVPEDDFAF